MTKEALSERLFCIKEYVKSSKIQRQEALKAIGEYLTGFPNCTGVNTDLVNALAGIFSELLYLVDYTDID